ncbi:MAG TPA: helix-turn-helix transcriptional regulator [Thermoanaerobaculia bacterium]|nr:helix-turn-helix transcriptional regulator [Thermoanaerobaculia bacterium]
MENPAFRHSSGVRPRGRSPSPHTLRQRLDRAADLYLRDCYKRKTAARADEFARHLELTRQYVARVSSGVLGVPLRDFLRERQLRYAEQLLLTTSYSVVDIAAMSAFGTHPTFYRAFKAAYGMTPGHYRSRFRNEHRLPVRESGR